MPHHHARFHVVSSVVSCLALGCGGGGGGEGGAAPRPFESSDDIRTWAQASSPLGVYAHAYEPIALADGEFSYPDPACPTTSDDGTTLTIGGDCTDSSGNERTGTATVERNGDDRTLTLEDFEEKNGTVSIRLIDTSLREFEAELVIGDVTTIDYVGTVEGGYGERTIWNGNGRVEREGFLAPTGEVEATTAEQVLDEAMCAQPASGTTTLQARGDTAVITYDGATDCDDDQNARLSVNGEDRAMISGIFCTLRQPGAKSTPGACWVLAALALGRLARRRRAVHTFPRFARKAAPPSSEPRL